MGPPGSTDHEALHQQVDPTTLPERTSGTGRLPFLPTLDGLATTIRVATLRFAPLGLVAARRSLGYVIEACRPGTSPGPAMHQAGATGKAMLLTGTSPWERLGAAERDLRAGPLLVRAPATVHCMCSVVRVYVC